MRELDPNGAAPPSGSELREVRRATRERWAVRAAQWKALELAREAFGEDASASLAPYPSRGAFRSMVRLAVPFRDLEDHQDRERHFLGLAAYDPILRRVPLVFVFDPVLLAPSGAESGK